MVLSTEVLLSVSRISKSFGGAKALNDVSVDFRAGEVHALLGENGAGKSTLVKVIAGVVTADTGEVTFPGGFESTDVAMVFQELSVIPELSVRDNMALSMRRTSGLLVRREKLQERMQSALTSAGLEDLDLDMPVEALPLAKRQLLEIARGLVADARTLILDEPTATLSDIEISRVHQVVRSLVSGGRSIVYITHRMGEVFRLADRITIMRSGSVVASGPTAEFTMDSVVTHMLGEEHAAGEAIHVAENFAPEKRRRLNVRGLASGHRFSDVSFTAQAGEVTALFGQIGSGADDVVRALVGLIPVTAGDIQLNEIQLSALTRPKSQKHGIAYVSADRVLEGSSSAAVSPRTSARAHWPGVSRLGTIRAELESTSHAPSPQRWPSTRHASGFPSDPSAAATSRRSPSAGPLPLNPTFWS